MADDIPIANITVNTADLKQGLHEAAQALQALSQHMESGASSSHHAGQAMDELGEHAGGLGFHIGKLRESFFEAFAARDLMWKALDAGKETIRAVIENTEEYEQANLKLNAVIRATGDASGVTAMQVRELSDQMERTTLYKSEDIENAAAAMMTFKNVQGDTFEQAVRYSADIASAYGMNIQEVARNLGRALDSPIQASRMLRTYGVALTKTQQEQIKQWDALGESAKEQGMILDILKGKFAGTAEEMDHGMKAQAHAVSTEFKDLTTNMGVFFDRSNSLVTIGTSNMSAFEQGLLRVVNLIPGVATLASMATGSPDELSASRMEATMSRYPEMASRLQAAGFSAQQTATPEAAFRAANQTVSGGADNATPAAYSAAKSMVSDLATIVNLREQSAAAAQKEQWAQEAAAKGMQAQQEAAREAARAAQAAAAAKAEAKLYQSDADKVHGLRDETTEMKMTNAEIARYEILHNSGNKALANEAYALQNVIDKYKDEQKALEAAAKAQDEANKKKQEAAARVAEYVEQLDEESDALQMGDGASPGGHRTAVKEAGGDPAQLAAIQTAEARLAFYKALAAAREQDAKGEENAANRVEALWEHSLKKIIDDFAGLFDKVLQGKEKSFRNFCGDLLHAWEKTLTQMGAEELTAKLFGNKTGPGGVAGGLLSHFFHHGSPQAQPDKMDGLLAAAIPHIHLGSGTPAPQLGAGGTAPAAPANQVAGLAMSGASLAMQLVKMFHGGGVVGVDGDSRWVSAAAFSGAPRYHDGLAGDEMPAILRQGESVLTPDQMREVSGGGGDVHVHLNLSAIDGRDAARFINENQGHISRIVTDAVQKSRTFSRRMSGK